MNVKSATQEKSNLKLVVTVDAETFEKGVNKVYLKNRGRIMIPGFRKGKAPRRVIEQFYGPDVFRADALEEIFPEIYTEATKGYKPVGSPSLIDVNYNEDKTVDVTFETALYPEVKLGQYKGLSVEKKEVKVTDAEVEAEVDRKAEEVARIITVDRPAQNGDTAVIDFEGFLEGVPFDGGKGEDYELHLGSGTFVPGFEDQVVGMSAGEEKDIHVTFPESYTPELAGKAVVFKVKVHEVKMTELPEKDDELAKDVSEFDTLDELRADIRSSLEKKAEQEAEDSFREAVLKKAIEAVEADIPEAMIDEKVEERAEQFSSQLQQQGMSLEMYAQYMGTTVDEFKKNFFRPNAEEMVKMDLLLAEVGKLEAPEITDEEFAAEIKQIAENASITEEEVRKYVSDDMIKGDILRRKSRDLIIDSAIPVKPSEEEAE